MIQKHANSQIPKRREFLKLTAGIVTGLGITSFRPEAWGNEALAETSQPISRDYLQQGLNALARAHHMSSMAGHLGASLIAGYFVGMQTPKLEKAVYSGIQDDLQRVKNGKSVFGKKMSRKSKLNDPQLFESFPKQKADATLIDGIAESLEQSIDQPRQSGHNVIFAALAIRALKEHPELSTPAVVDGIRRLMMMFKNQSPGSGYYGKERGRIHGNKVLLPEDDSTPQYTEVNEMVDAVLEEIIQLRPDVNRVGYGGMVHLINHAAAITELAELGYQSLANRAVKSHHKHLRLWHNLPNVAEEKGAIAVSSHTPHSAEYWATGTVPYDRALLTHRVKTMYGFHELASAVQSDEKYQTAFEKLRYFM